MMLTGLAAVLRDAGEQVVEMAGWKTRGHGQMSDLRTITWHHTAGGRSTRRTRSLNTVMFGRPGLAGPLCHLYLDTDGTWYVVAAGLAWHAGESRSPDYTNTHAIGIEAEAAGDGWDQDWPAVQMKAYRRGTRALADHYGVAISNVRAHKETCYPDGRKPDPYPMNMDTERSRVRATDLEDDMPTAQEIVNAILAAPIGTWLDRDGNEQNDRVSLAFAVGAAYTDAYGANQKATQNAKDIEALAELVKVLTDRVQALATAVAIRSEDGLYVRVAGQTAVFAVSGIGTEPVRVWLTPEDYSRLGRPPVRDVPAEDPLVKARVLNEASMIAATRSGQQ